MLIWIRLQCFLLSKHGAGISPRNLWLLEIDESTPPFSCKEFRQVRRTVHRINVASSPHHISQLIDSLGFTLQAAALLSYSAALFARFAQSVP